MIGKDLDKEIYKNPIFYYILAPVIAALWPLMVWGVYLPAAEHNWQTEKMQYLDAQNVIMEILKLDPDRLKFADSQETATEFDYASAVEKVASLCDISSTSYRLSSGIMLTSGGQKSQSANVDLNEISITKFAQFLSAIQLRWANLQCTGVKLTKDKGLPDVWDVDLSFKYYY